MPQATATALALLPAAAVLGLAGCAPPGSARPSLVLLSVDTLTPELLATPEVEHPALDRLAAASLRFTDALSTASWTLPAHASLMTGLYPDRHGATDLRTSIAPGLPRLAGFLRDAGYRTVAFTDGTYLDPLFGFAEGFELYDGVPGSGAPAGVPELPRGGRPNEVRGESLFDRAVAYLEARSERTPLFLFLHTYAVHDYPQLRPWVRAALPADGFRSSGAFFDCLQGRSACPDEMWAELEVAYRAELAHLDEGLARLVEALDDAGLGEGSYFVLLSDHGEGFDFRLGRIHHGGRLHADQLRVPLWISGPGVSPGETAVPISLVDVMPTLLELLGVPAPAGLDGRSLAPIVTGSGAPPELAARPLFAMEHYFLWEDGRRTNAPAARTDALQVAVVRGPRWYIRDGEREELYDMAADPRQRVDLAPHLPESDELEALAASRGHVAAGRTPLEVPDRIVEELRGLGYVH
jgi:arylsulfatase A-like enzyme